MPEEALSLDREVSAILDRLNESRDDPWGDHARVIADGIRESGLAGQIQVSSGALRAELAAIGSVIGAATSQIVDKLAQSNDYLDQISHSLSNPRATAADERFRNGLMALQKGWNDDAARELAAAIQKYPFSGATHALLGIARSRLGLTEESISSFRAAVKYSESNDLPLTAQCAILAANSLDSLGRANEAAAFLADDVPDIDFCPELILVRAHVSGSDEGVQSAIWWAPELAVAAVARGISGSERAAEDSITSTEGPVVQAKEVAASLRLILSTTDVPVSDLLRDVYSVTDEQGPEALSAAGHIFLRADEMLAVGRSAMTQAVASDTEAKRAYAAAHAEERRVQQQTANSSDDVARWATLAFISWLITLAPLPWGISNANQGALPIAALVAGLLLVVFSLPLTFGWLKRRTELRKARESMSASNGILELISLTSPDQSQAREKAFTRLQEILEYRKKRLIPWFAHVAETQPGA